MNADILRILRVDKNAIQQMRCRIKRGYRPKPLTLIAYRLVINTPLSELSELLDDELYNDDLLTRRKK